MLGSVDVVAGALRCAFGREPLVAAARSLELRVGGAKGCLGPDPRFGGGAGLGLARRECCGQSLEESRNRRCLSPQLSNVRLVAFDLAQGLRRAGVAPLELLRNRKERLHEALILPMALIDLGTLGGSFSDAVDVSDSGQVVGFSSTAGDEAFHPFSWTRSSGIVDLGTLGGSFSKAETVNASGQVVGFSSTAGDVTNHAFY